MDGIRRAAFRPDIEGLRGIAILIVVAFHCGLPGFAGGFVGVDVFFALSGYLITERLIHEIQETSRLRVVAFYARRVRRLLPASALVVGITLLVGAALLAPHELNFTGRAARSTALAMSNIFFALNVADYFTPQVEANPLSHTWSLAVEEQFYLVWPALIMLGLQRWRSRRALLGLLCGLTALSLAASVWFSTNGPVFAFYGLPTRLWEFGLGGLAVMIPRGTLKLSSRQWLVFGWCGLAAILVSGFVISGESNFPGWIALLPVLGTAAVLLAGAELPDRGVGVALRSAPLQTFGTLAYCWYLWHWPFLVFSTALLPNLSTAAKIAVAAGALVTAAITNRFVENPIRFHPQLVRRPALSLSLAGVITLFSLSGALLCKRFADQLLGAPEMMRIAQAVNDVADLPRQECINVGESTDVKTCVFGDPSSATHLVLFGDSHALQWFNPTQRIAASHRWRLTTVLKTGCGAAGITVRHWGAQFAASCDAWRATAIQRIISMRPSMVLLGSATTHLARQGRPASRFDVSLAEWSDGTKRTLEALTSAGLRVAVMRDTPTASFDVPACLARVLRYSWYPGARCEMDRSVSVDAAVFDAEQAGASGLQNVRFVDLTDRLCEPDVCRAVQGGVIVYRNSNHLTGSFAGSMMPALEAKLLPIMNENSVLVADPR